MVQASEVSYAYPQHGYGLLPISLELQVGDAVLIAGPSGSGKSTLARCLSGLIPHLYHGNLSGEVWLDGLHTSGAPVWHMGKSLVKWVLSAIGGPVGFVALGLARALVGYIVFGALGATGRADLEGAAQGRLLRLPG